MPFDRDYLERLAAGDQTVEQHFGEYFGRGLSLKLRRRIRSVQLIEDIRQETLLRVLASIRAGEIKHPERLGAFVNSVCNNVLREMLRGEDRLPGAGLAAESQEGAAEDIEAAIIGKEQKQLVAAALDGLPFRDREVLRLVLIEGRDRREVCRMVGVDGAHLRVLLHRALARVRDLIAKRSSKDTPEV